MAIARIIAVGIALVTAVSSAAAQEKVRFQLDWTPIGSHAAAYLAVAKGYFRDAGLDVTLSDGKGGTAVVQQIAAGQVDVGQAALSGMAAARSNGVPVTSIAGFVRAGDIGLMVPRGKNFKSVKDLEGQRIAYTASTAAGPFLDPFFKGSGTSRDKFTIVNVDSNSLVSVYTSGNVDAVWTAVAFMQPAIEGIRPSDGLMLAEIGLRLPGYGLVVQEKTLAERPEMLQRFTGAVMKAWKYIFDGHVDEAVDAIMAQRPNDKLDRAILKGQLEAYMPLFFTPSTKSKPLGWQSEEDWTGALTAMEAAQMIKPGSKSSDYYTNKFIPE